MLRSTTTFLAIAALCAAPYAAAQPESALPEMHTQAGVKYMDGGVGKDESTAMLRESKNFPLALVFSGGKANNYVADVDIRVRDAAGKTVLQTNSDGPIMLVDLPAGKYIVDAQYRGETLTRGIQLSGKGSSRVDFHWSAAD